MYTSYTTRHTNNLEKKIDLEIVDLTQDHYFQFCEHICIYSELDSVRIMHVCMLLYGFMWLGNVKYFVIHPSTYPSIYNSGTYLEEYNAYTVF